MLKFVYFPLFIIVGSHLKIKLIIWISEFPFNKSYPNKVVYLCNRCIIVRQWLMNDEYTVGQQLIETNVP